MSGLGHLNWQGSPIWSPWANPRMLFHWAEILKKLKHTVQWSLILLHACMLSSFSPSAAKLLQSCPTLWDPTDGSPPGAPIPGTLQARALEWVAISFSDAGRWKVKGKSLSCVRPLATPWTAAHQAPLSMGFSRPRVLEWENPSNNSNPI